MARICAWHVKQVSESRLVLSCALVDWKSWTLWQLTQDRPRRSWTPPPQLACRALSWQARQVWFTWSGFSFLMETIGPGSPFSTAAFRCSVGSPWQDAHFVSSREWGVPAMLATGFSWQVRQSLTLKEAGAAVASCWAWARSASTATRPRDTEAGQAKPFIARAAFPAGGP